MKKLNLFAGIAVALSGLFASQTFAASGCVSAACDPAAAAAACDPAAAAAACDPAAACADPAPTPDCLPGCQPATCAASPTCDPAAAAACNSGCNSGCLSAAACGIGAPCNSCGSPACNGSCRPHGCAEAAIGKFQKSLSGICWSGYMNAGYNTNFSGDRSNGYTDCWSNSTPAFNALYVAATKKAYTGGCGADWGFGMDFMFGEDARILRSARGWDDSWVTGHMYDPITYPLTGTYTRDSYGFAMPQLYMEFAINNWSVKMGHFYSLLGYEGATANKRFFYTKGIMCQLTPVAQTGVIASYNGFENLDLSLGWVNGWGNGFDNSQWGEGAIEGAFTYHMNEFASIKYAFMAGTVDAAGFGGITTIPSAKVAGSVHNIVADLQLTRNLEAVSLFYYGEAGGINSALVFGEHLYYDVNCCVRAGFRAEWMKIRGLGLDTEVTTYAIGLNLHPAGIQNLYIRPELRYDRATGAFAPFVLNGRPDQLTIGFDVMLTF